MTREDAIAVLQRIKPTPCRADGKSITHALEMIALDMAIKSLEQKPCDDAISRQAALDTFGLSEKSRKYGGDHSGYDTIMLYEVQDALEALPSVQPQPKTGHWIPVKWHEITDEEREREGYSKDWVCYLDSEMPYDGQRILVTTKSGYVELDECYSDDGQTFSLDSGYDWVDDIIAWMPLPEPYKAESKDKK